MEKLTNTQNELIKIINENIINNRVSILKLIKITTKSGAGTTLMNNLNKLEELGLIKFESGEVVLK